MPTRTDPWPAGTPCWVDLSVPDVPAALAFYRSVLGWTAVDSGEEFGHYQICHVGDRAAAGIGPVMQEGQPSAWTVYLASEDADGSAKAIGEAGGTVVMGPMDIPGSGRMVIAADPAGAVFGVWQAAEMSGIAVYNEPGGLAWEDARLTDPDAGKAFYAGVFGYRYTPVEGAPPDYQIFDIGDGPLGGIGPMMGAPEGTPSHWIAYFAVPDTDAAVAAVRSGGGSVLSDPVDTPFGRMSIVADPDGATFVVITPPSGG